MDDGNVANKASFCNLDASMYDLLAQRRIRLLGACQVQLKRFPIAGSL